MFFEAVRDHAAAEDLRRFFAPDVARSITAADEELTAGQGSLRDVAVMMIDIRGFTRIAAGLPPETVMMVLSRYQDAVLEVIARHGGEVDKFLGDGILATFGAARPRATAAADAVKAGLELPQVFAGLGPELADLGWPERLRAGAAIASGPVTVGVVGAAGRLEFTVIGDAVNRAAKLEDANKGQGSIVLTDRATFETALAQGVSGFQPEIRPAQVVSGLSEPLDLVVLA